MTVKGKAGGSRGEAGFGVGGEVVGGRISWLTQDAKQGRHDGAGIEVDDCVRLQPSHTGPAAR